MWSAAFSNAFMVPCTPTFQISDCDVSMLGWVALAKSTRAHFLAQSEVSRDSVRRAPTREADTGRCGTEHEQWSHDNVSRKKCCGQDVVEN